MAFHSVCGAAIVAGWKGSGTVKCNAKMGTHNLSQLDIKRTLKIELVNVNGNCTVYPGRMKTIAFTPYACLQYSNVILC